MHPSAAQRGSGIGSKFFFRREGRAWRYRYDGGEPKILLPSIGASYLYVLLSWPGREFWAGELVGEVLGSHVRDGSTIGEDAMDDEALEQLHATCGDYVEQIDAARRCGDEGLVSLLEEELSKHLVEAGKVAHRGRKKRIGDYTERLRTSVGMAILRTRRQMERDGDKLFAEHLRRTIRCGRTPRYLAPDGVIWMTT